MTALDPNIEQKIIDYLAKATLVTTSDDLTKVNFAMQLDSDGESEVIQLEDQLLYLVLDLPIQSQLIKYLIKSDALILSSLEKLAAECDSRCLGVIIRPTPESPKQIIIFPPGEIWALRELGDLRPDQKRINQINPLVDGTVKTIHHIRLAKDLIIGEPSAELIPLKLRKDLAERIKEITGVKIPKACVVKDLHADAFALVYNFFTEDQRGSNQDQDILTNLHPSNYPIKIVSRSLGLERYMRPLVS